MTRKLVRRTIAVVLIAILALLGAGCSADSEADTPSVTPTTTIVVEQLTEEEAQDVENERLWQESNDLLDPLSASVAEGASPEMALRELVELSCAQSLDNPFYWEYANFLYEGMVDRGSADGLLVSDWPLTLAAALKSCFEAEEPALHG